jgi:hypothetical protein
MAPEQRRQLLLAAVAVVLAGAAYRIWTGPSPTAAGRPTTSNVRNQARARDASASMTAPEVHLETLTGPRPEPGAAERNLFRFKPKPALAPPPVAAPPRPPTTPPGPPPGSAVAPIALKFIGMWELPEQKRKIAMLTDGRGGVPIYGAEGDVVEGRYKILRIGVESIEMSYLDGRGRQTIRLSGQ